MVGATDSKSLTVSRQWEEGWPDEVHDLAVSNYEVYGSAPKVRALLRSLGYVDSSGNAPTERIINRWVDIESKRRKVDLRKEAMKVRRNLIQEKAFDKADAVLDRIELVDTAPDAKMYSEAARNLYEIGNKAEIDSTAGEKETIEDWFAIIGRRRVKSHSQLEYINGEYKELEAENV